MTRGEWQWLFRVGSLANRSAVFAYSLLMAKSKRKVVSRKHSAERTSRRIKRAKSSHALALPAASTSSRADPESTSLSTARSPLRDVRELRELSDEALIAEALRLGREVMLEGEQLV